MAHFKLLKCAPMQKYPSIRTASIESIESQSSGCSTVSSKAGSASSAQLWAGLGWAGLGWAGLVLDCAPHYSSPGQPTSDLDMKMCRHCLSMIKMAKLWSLTMSLIKTLHQTKLDAEKNGNSRPLWCVVEFPKMSSSTTR